MSLAQLPYVDAKAEWWRARPSNASDFGGKCCVKGGLAWVPYKPCRGLLYDYVGPGASKSFDDLSLSLRTAIREVGDVVILGDSISRQLFESLVCFVGGGWKGWQKVRDHSPATMQHLRKIFGGRLPVLNTGQLGYANVSVGPNSSLFFYTLNDQQVTIQDLRRVLAFHAGPMSGRIYIDWKFIHVGFPGTELHAKIAEVVRACVELNLTETCVLREPTPQHFVEWDRGAPVFTHGLHNQSFAQHQFKCINKLVLRHDPRARFRADIVWQNRGNISVLPLMDALLPRGDGHIDADCTHYAFDPSLWHAVHATILLDLKRLRGSSRALLSRHS